MPADGSGGFFLSLLTESFAVRALLGSLAAAALAGLAVHFELVRGRRARRLLVLAPVAAVGASGVAVAATGGGYLPQLWVASGTEGPAGQALELLGELRVVSPSGGLDVLLMLYGGVALVLVGRRLLGLLACHRLVRRAEGLAGHGAVAPVTYRLSVAMGVAVPQMKLLPGCPGGAFAAGVLHPVIVVDPALLQQLDEHETEGLVAHELAHLRRRDPLTGLLVGLCRDLTFFLPPLHLAARWLRREQEESADELASEHTRRPGALASSILKVWDSARGGGGPRVACAALGQRRLAFATGGARWAASANPAAIAVAARIERLLDDPVGRLSRIRLRAEAVLAGTVTIAAVAAALVVPGWLASGLNAYSLSFVYLSSPPLTETESPAFATFRALAPERGSEGGLAGRPSGSAVSPGLAERSSSPACPCVENQAQLRQGVAAEGVSISPRMLWRDPEHSPWQVINAREGAMQSRPLWTLADSGAQVGFFVVARGN